MLGPRIGKWFKGKRSSVAIINHDSDYGMASEEGKWIPNTSSENVAILTTFITCLRGLSGVFCNFMVDSIVSYAYYIRST